MANTNCLRCGCLISDIWTRCTTCQGIIAREKKAAAVMADNSLPPLRKSRPYNPINDPLGYWR
jgi:hypothetical protein